MRVEYALGILVILMLIFSLLSYVHYYRCGSLVNASRADVVERLRNVGFKPLTMVWRERGLDSLIQALLIVSVVAGVALLFKGWRRI